VGLGNILIDALAIAPGERISLVGGGGKTTLMQQLVVDATARGWTCVAGTTTKVYAAQAEGFPVFLAAHRVDDKLVGLEPDAVNRYCDEHRPHLCVIEADGSRSRRVKAPSATEPPIPSGSTLVIAVIGADALDRVIEDVAHRPMLVAAVCGCSPYGRLTPERAAELLTSERGGRKNVPAAARFSVAITRIGPRQQALAQRLQTLLASHGVPAVLLPLLQD
jgi:hypothetical protein